jgi:hypothetical protein
MRLPACAHNYGGNGTKVNWKGKKQMMMNLPIAWRFLPALLVRPVSPAITVVAGIALVHVQT